MVISILGCGWYGRALADKLLNGGMTVKGSTTTLEKMTDLEREGILPYVARFEQDTALIVPDFFHCDIIVVAIPPGFKKNQGQHYVPKIKRIIEAIAEYKIPKVIYISSTSVYSDCNHELTEHDIPQPDSESGKTLYEAERLFLNEHRFKTTVIRFGGLIGPGRNPGRFFSGKTGVPNGRAPVNLIHQSDCVGITIAIIEKDIFGLVLNACAPDHPAKKDFYSQTAVKSKLPLPQFIDELANWKIVHSVILSEKLHYKFTIKNWDTYLESGQA
ncbi:MAG: SDR family oxidoreductase [Bacteroidetes bacterium]|nr:SDR family oxidoreductase [Bacteroidota bacterium]